TLSSEVAEQSIIHNEVAEQSTNHTELLEFSESSSEEEDYANDASNLCQINLPSDSLASPLTIFSQYLPINYIEQNIICSINLLGRSNNLNWIDINLNEYITWLGLWVLMSIVPVSDHHYYWRMQENTQPLMPFNFQHWITLLHFEQIVSQHTLMMLYKLEITFHNDPLFLVRSFTNAFNTNLIEAIIPRSVLCIDEPMNSWLVIADGLTNIVIQLESCEDKVIEKINVMLQNMVVLQHMHAWPINYPDDMVEKLNSAYGSYISKVATLNSIRLIAASL
ncbi:4867_t:CDS:2, partial [Gigaspora margarita]